MVGIVFAFLFAMSMGTENKAVCTNKYTFFGFPNDDVIIAGYYNNKASYAYCTLTHSLSLFLFCGVSVWCLHIKCNGNGTISSFTHTPSHGDLFDTHITILSYCISWMTKREREKEESFCLSNKNLKYVHISETNFVHRNPSSQYHLPSYRLHDEQQHTLTATDNRKATTLPPAVTIQRHKSQHVKTNCFVYLSEHIPNMYHIELNIPSNI